MAYSTSTRTPAAYAVVIDGHTAQESTRTLGSFATSVEAQAACDQANAEVAALGTSAHRWHVEAR
jgi:hypothetical protein